MLGWTGDNGDPDNFLCYFFCPDRRRARGSTRTRRSPTCSSAPQRSRSQTERAKLYRQAEQMIHDNVSRVFIANNEPPLAFSKKVKGYVPQPARRRAVQHRRDPVARGDLGGRGPVRRYAIRRSLTIVPVLLGVSVLVFSFVHLIPGDPALTMLGERATPEKVAEVRARLGLDRPIHEQYVLYIGKALRGDLGVSIVRGDPGRSSDLLRRFPATVELAVAAIVVAILVRHPDRRRLRRLAQLAARQPLASGRAHRRLDADLLARPRPGVVLRRPARTRCRPASVSPARPSFVPWTHFVILDSLLQRQLGHPSPTRFAIWYCPRWRSRPSRSRLSPG